jgi:hypothetical protein
LTLQSVFFWAANWWQQCCKRRDGNKLLIVGKANALLVS